MLNNCSRLPAVSNIDNTNLLSIKDFLALKGVQGLYSSFEGEKPPCRKLPFLADFIENWAPFIENSILTIFTDPKAKRSENVPNNQI